MKKTLLIQTLTAVIGGMLFFPFDLSAQFSSFLDGKIQRRDRSKPTMINAESMDIDINNNRVTLIGNVDVDDPEMNIKCRKMVIYLSAAPKKEKKTAEKAAVKKQVAPKQDLAATFGPVEEKKDGKKKKKSSNELDRDLDRIECIGEVVISRSTGSADGKNQEIQRAYAGEAIYYVKEEKIVLKDNPVVVSSQNRLTGEIITLYPKTERILVLKPKSQIKGGIGNVGGSMKRK